MYIKNAFLAYCLALSATVGAFPLVKRSDNVVGNPENPVDDLLTNFKSGLEGGLDFLDLGGSDKAKRTDPVAAVGEFLGPTDDVATEAVGEPVKEIVGALRPYDTKA